MVAPQDFNELIRRIESLVRVGAVASVDLQAARCRVQTGQLTTDWLPWYAMRAGAVNRWSPPTVGEQCIVLSPGGDTVAGLVLYGLYSDAKPAADDRASIDSVTYADGAVVSYDQVAHKLTATLPAGGSAEIVAPQQIKLTSSHIVLDAEHTDITGTLTVHGLLTWLDGMAGSGIAAGGGANAAVISGTVQADHVMAGDISLEEHHHLWSSTPSSEAQP